MAKKQKGQLRPSPPRSIRDCIGETGSRPDFRPASLAHRPALEFNASPKKPLQRSRASNPCGTSSCVPHLYSSAQAADVVKPCEHQQRCAEASSEEQAAVQLVPKTPRRTSENGRSEDATREAKASAALAVYSPRVSFCDTAGSCADLLKGSSGAETQVPPNSPDLHTCTDYSGVLSAASHQTADSDASNADRSELSKFDLTPRATYQSPAMRAGRLDTRSQEARLFCKRNTQRNAKSASGRTQPPATRPLSPALLPADPLVVSQREFSDRRLALQRHLATLERRLTDFLGIVAAAAPGALGAAIGVAAAGPPANQSMSCTSAAKGPGCQGSSTRQKPVGPCRVAVQKPPLWGSVEATPACSAGGCGGLWRLGRTERPSSRRSREADQLGDTLQKSKDTGERFSIQKKGDTRPPEEETPCGVPTHSQTENSGGPLSDAWEAKVRRLTEGPSRIHQHPCNAHSPTASVQPAGQVRLARGLLSIGACTRSSRSSQSVSSLTSESSDVSGEQRTSGWTAVSPMSPIFLRGAEAAELAATSPASGPSPWQRRPGGAHRLRNGRQRRGQSGEGVSSNTDRGTPSRSSAKSVARVQKVALHQSAGDAFLESSDLKSGDCGSRGVASGGARGPGGKAADRERRVKSPERRDVAAEISNACAQTPGSTGVQELSHESLSGLASLSGADCTPALSCCSVSACSGFGHGLASTPVSSEKPTDWTATPSTAATCTPEMTARSQLSPQTTQRVALRLPSREKREGSFDGTVNEKALQTPGKEAKREDPQLFAGTTLAATQGEDWRNSPSEKRSLERRNLPSDAALFLRVPASEEFWRMPAAPLPDGASRRPVGSPASPRGPCRLCRSEQRDSSPHKETKGASARSCGQTTLQPRAEQLSRNGAEEGIPTQLLQHLLLVLQCLDEVKNMQVAFQVGVAPPAEARGLEASSGALDTAKVCLPSTAALLSATAAPPDEEDLLRDRWRERGRLVADVAVKSTHAAAMAGALAALPSSEEARKRRGALRRQAPKDQADAFDRLSAAVLAVTEAAADAAACAAHETEDDRETELLKRGPQASRLEKRPSSRPFRESGRGCRTQLAKEKLRFFRSFSTPGGRSRHATRSSASAKEGRHLEDVRARQRRRKRRAKRGLDSERERLWGTRREARGCLRRRGDASSSESEPGANGVNETKSEADRRRCLGFPSRLRLETELRRREDTRSLKEARERQQNGALSLLQGSWVIRLLPPASPERKVEQRGCAAAARSAAANFFLSFAGGRRGRESASKQEPEREASSSFASRLFGARSKESGSDRATLLPRQEKCFLFVSADFSHLCCTASPPPSVVRATEGSRAAGDLRRAARTATEPDCSLGGAETSSVPRKDSRELCAGKGRRGKDATRRRATPAADALRCCQGPRRTQALSADGTEASTAKSETHAGEWTLAEETVDHGFGATSGRSENGESDVGGSPASSQKPRSDLPFSGGHTPGSNWGSEGRGGSGAEELLTLPCRRRPHLHVAIHETQGTHAVSPLEESRAGDILAPGISSQSLEAKTCSPTRLGADRRVPCCTGPSAATRVRISEGDRGTTVLGFCCASDSSLTGSRASRTSGQRITPVVASPCCAWEERTPESECSLCGDMTASTVSALTPESRRTLCQKTENLGRAGHTPQLKAPGALVVAFSDGQGDDSEGADTDASVAPSVLCVALPAFASCQRRRHGRAKRKTCLSSPSSATTGDPGHAELEARRPRKETSLKTACFKRSVAASSQRAASKPFLSTYSGSAGGRRDQRDKGLNPLDRSREPTSPSSAVATSPLSSGKASGRQATTSRYQTVGARGSPLREGPSQVSWKSPQLIVPLSAVESVEYGYSSSAYNRLQRSNCAPLVAIPPYLCCSIRVRRNRDQTQEGSETGNLTDCSSAASVASCWSACTPQSKPEWRRWGTEGGKTPRTGFTREDDLEAFDFIVLSEGDAAKWAVSLNSVIRHDPLRARFTAEEFSYQLHVMRQHHTQRLRLECLLAHTQLHARRGPEACSESGSKWCCERREPAGSAHSSASRAADLEALAGIRDFTAAICGWQEVQRNANSGLEARKVRSRSDRDSDFVVERSVLRGKILEGETLESEVSASDTDASWREASCESSRRYASRQGARRPRRRYRPYRFSSAPPQICGCSCCSTTTGSGADLNSGDEYVRLRSWAPSALSRLPSSLRGPSSRRGRTSGDPRTRRLRVSPKAGDTPTRGATFSRALASTVAEGDGSQSRAGASVGESNVVDACVGRQGCSCPRCVGIRTAAERLVRAVPDPHSREAFPVPSSPLPAPKIPEEQDAPGACGYVRVGVEEEETALPDASEPPKQGEAREEKAHQKNQMPSTSTAQVAPVRGQSLLCRGMSDVTPGALGVKRGSEFSRSLQTPALATPPRQSLVVGPPGVVPNSVLGRELAALPPANSSLPGLSLPGEQERLDSTAVRSLWRSRSFAAPAASAEMRRWASAGVSSVSNCGSRSGSGTPASRGSTAQALLRFVSRGWKASRRREARFFHTQSEHRGTEGLVSGEETPPCMGPTRGWPPSGPATQSCLCRLRPPALRLGDKLDASWSVETDTEKAEFFSPVVVGPYPPLYLNSVRSHVSGHLSPPHITQRATWVVPGLSDCGGCAAPVRMHQMNPNERLVESHGSACEAREVMPGLSVETQGESEEQVSRGCLSGSVPVALSGAQPEAKRWGALTRGFGLFARRRNSEKATQAAAGRPGFKRSASCFTAGDRQAVPCMRPIGASAFPWALRPTLEPASQTPAAGSCRSCSAIRSLPQGDAEELNRMHSVGDQKGLESAAPEATFPVGIFAPSFPPVFRGRPCCLPLTHQGGRACHPRRGWAGCSLPLVSLHGVCGAAQNWDSGRVEGTPSGPVGPSLLGTHTAGGETVFAERLVVPLHQALHRFPHNPHDPEKGPVPPTCLHRRPHILAVGGMLYRCQTHEWLTPKGECGQPGTGELPPVWPTAGLHQVPVSSPHEPEQNLTPVSDRSQDLQVSRRSSVPPREVSTSAEGWERRGEENTEKADLPATVSSDVLSKQTRERPPQETESSPETLTTPVAVSSLSADVGDEDEEEVQFCIFSEDEETRTGERDWLHAAARCPVP